MVAKNDLTYGSDWKWVDVTPLPPAITIDTVTGSPDPSTTCDTVEFIAHGMAYRLTGSLEFTWDFGDGQTGTGNPAYHRYSQLTDAGVHTVTVTVKDSGSDTSATKNTQQTVTLPPVTMQTLTSSVNPATICDNIQFTALATETCGGENPGYAWTFGDGSTGTGSAPTHQYAAAGSYAVTVIATDSVTQQTATRTLMQVVSPPAITITNESSSSPNATTCDTIQFTGAASLSCGTDALTYTWNFGGDGTATGQAVSHRFTTGSPTGGFTVTLTVTDPSTGISVQKTLQQTVTLVSITIPMFYNYPSPATTCDNVTFYAWANNPCGNNNLVYYWDFGDQTSSAGSYVQHQYAHASPAAGYPVILTVTDPVSGMSAQRTVYEVVTLAPLTIGMIYNYPTPATTCDPVQFYAWGVTPCGSNNLVYTWDFKDGTFGTGNSPTHQFTAASGPGGYNVTVTATDPVTTQTATRQVQQVVNWPTITIPMMYSDLSPATTCDTVDFYAQGSEGTCNSANLTYDWDFGDGDTDTGYFTSHQYWDPGTYTVTCTVSDPVTGVQVMRSLSQIVTLPTITIYNASSSKPIATTCDTVQFNAMAGGGCTLDGLIYDWDFKDGTTATGPSPTHQFTAATPAGGLPVSLTITDPDSGAFATTTITETVTAPTVTLNPPTASVNPALVSQQIQFNASVQQTCSSPSTTYHWTFGDGGSAEGASPTYAYPKASPTDGFTVHVTATDPTTGKTDSKSLQIVVAPEQRIRLTSAKTDLCAGGWNNAQGDYVYLVKETGQIAHRTQPDPHVTTVTATVSGPDGLVAPDQTVTFSWKMPGNAPVETHQVTTNSMGQASVDVISGDKASQLTDDQGNVLFDSPVPVTAECNGIQQEVDLNVLKADAQWLYLDDNGQYQPWDGNPYCRNRDGTTPLALKVKLTFGPEQTPVVGHQVNWVIRKVLNKMLSLVPPDSNGEFPNYGHLSGQISTTESDGGATATFMHGDRFGNLTFEMDDASVHAPTIPPVSPPGNGTNTAASRTPTTASFALQVLAQNTDPGGGVTGVGAAAGQAGQQATLNDWEKYTQNPKNPKVMVYTWVQNFAPSADNIVSYPAPSHEEDDELLPETMDRVYKAIYKSNESTTLNRGQSQGDQNGTWWISQAIGDDPDSKGSHYCDMVCNEKDGKYGYGAAFDIVLTGIYIYENAIISSRTFQERSDYSEYFKPYVQALRDRGIVCWHRWSGEPDSRENEIHCIDPACYGYYEAKTVRSRSGKLRTIQTFVPLMKEHLRGQVDLYRRRLAGGNNYKLDYVITTDQVIASNKRQNDDYNTILANHPGIKYHLVSP